jgi:hypothetical protein
MALKFAASILHPSTKSSGPCSIRTIQQKLAPKKTINQAKRRNMVGSTGSGVSFRFWVLGFTFQVRPFSSQTGYCRATCSLVVQLKT